MCDEIIGAAVQRQAQPLRIGDIARERSGNARHGLQHSAADFQRATEPGDLLVAPAVLGTNIVLRENPPNFLARTPHGYHDTRRIEADVREAGFQDVSITTVTERSTAENARDVAIAFCQGTPMRVELEARGPQALQMMTDAAEKALASVFGDGEISGTIQAHVVVAGG